MKSIGLGFKFIILVLVSVFNLYCGNFLYQIFHNGMPSGAREGLFLVVAWMIESFWILGLFLTISFSIRLFRKQKNFAVRLFSLSILILNVALAVLCVWLVPKTF